MKLKPLTYEEFGELLTEDIDDDNKKCSYIKGKLNGIYLEWYEFSNRKHKRVETTYVDGKIHGKYLQWSWNGVLEKNCNYDHGILYGSYSHNISDKLTLETNYVNGKIDGLYTKLWSSY